MNQLVSLVIADQATCDFPMKIPDGRVCDIDGQKPGSVATYACDDYFAPVVLNGVCSLDGTWIGFASPCEIKVPSLPMYYECKSWLH